MNNINNKTEERSDSAQPNIVVIIIIAITRDGKDADNAVGESEVMVSCGVEEHRWQIARPPGPCIDIRIPTNVKRQHQHRSHKPTMALFHL